MRNFLKFLLVIVVIGVVGVILYTAKFYMNDKEKSNINTSSKTNTAQTPTNQVKKDDATVATATANVKETNEDEPIIENGKSNEETSTKDEDKAIELAKKKYGSSNGVYFRVEQIQSNNVYIISVRDNETTRDLEWYTVDIKNGTVK